MKTIFVPSGEKLGILAYCTSQPRVVIAVPFGAGTPPLPAGLARAEAASFCEARLADVSTRWHECLVCVPVPSDVALPDDVARGAVERAVVDAAAAGVHGPALTPWLLARIAELTAGASIRANTGLIVNDARIAGELAARLAGAVPG